jgi:hypothetical protein
MEFHEKKAGYKHQLNSALTTYMHTLMPYIDPQARPVKFVDCVGLQVFL